MIDARCRPASTELGYRRDSAPTSLAIVIPDRAPCTAALLLLAAAPALAQAASSPLWEAGIGIVGVHGPDYPAAGNRHGRVAIAPIVVYRGERLRVDDEGVRGKLLASGRFELDVSGAAAFNVRQSPARTGMPDLDYSFELGPQGIYRMPLGGGQQLSAHLQARAVFSTDWRRIAHRGFALEPELRWRHRGWPTAGSQVQLGLQATWGSQKLQDYFYEVAPTYATAARPAYDARAGYFGAALRGSWSQRLTPTATLSMGLTINDHSGAVNRASPLFQRTHTTSAVIAVVWTPWRGGSAGDAEARP